jgi:hypothetical protein
MSAMLKTVFEAYVAYVEVPHKRIDNFMPAF